MDADLVRPPGVQRAPQRAFEAVGGEPRSTPRPSARACRTPTMAMRVRILRIAADRCVDGEPEVDVALPTMRDREIATVHLARRDGPAPAPSPMPASLPTTIRPEVSLSSRWTMPARGSAALAGIAREQGVQQGARPVSGSGVHHHAGSLVDHEHVASSSNTTDERQRFGADRPGSPPSGTRVTAMSWPDSHALRAGSSTTDSPSRRTVPALR